MRQNKNKTNIKNLFNYTIKLPEANKATMKPKLIGDKIQ